MAEMSAKAKELIELVNQYGKAAHDYGLGDVGAGDEMTDLWREINSKVAAFDAPGVSE